MHQDPSAENYQRLIERLRENPKILLDIIPTSKRLGNNKIKDRIKKNTEEVKKEFIIRKNTDSVNKSAIIKMRPGTSGTHGPLGNISHENLDLISNIESKPASSFAQYIDSQTQIHPSSTKNRIEVMNQSVAELTKERILKLSDTELSKYMEKVAKARNKQSSYWSFFPQNYSTPETKTSYYRKGRKAQR